VIDHLQFIVTVTCPLDRITEVRQVMCRAAQEVAALPVSVDIEQRELVEDGCVL
jgi:hypothetical protein